MVQRRQATNMVRTARRDSDVARTVIVACKLPNGLILCTQHFEEETIIGPGHTSMRVKVARRDPIQYEVRGNAIPFGVRPDFDMRGGYAFTRNIPKEFWEQWLEQNKDSDIVKNKLIFAFETMDDAQMCAKDHAKVRSGLEPLDPNNLPVKGIKTLKKDEVD